jgi:hypothetical protein
VDSLSHPVNVICEAVIEESGMKLSNYFSIPVIFETHQILHLKSLNYLKDLFHFKLVKLFKVLPVNPLLLPDPWFAQANR